MPVSSESSYKCPICGSAARYEDGYYFCYAEVDHVVDGVYYKAGIEKKRKELLNGEIKEYE